MSKGESGPLLAGLAENWYYTGMFKKKRFNWRRKSNFLLAGLAIGGLALLTWLVLGSIDSEAPWLKVSEQVAVVGPNSAFSLKAGDRGSGMKEIRVTIYQAGQDKTVLNRTFPPGEKEGRRWKSPSPWTPRPWA